MVVEIETFFCIQLCMPPIFMFLLLRYWGWGWFFKWNYSRYCFIRLKMVEILYSWNASWISYCLIKDMRNLIIQGKVYCVGYRRSKSVKMMLILLLSNKESLICWVTKENYSVSIESIFICVVNWNETRWIFFFFIFIVHLVKYV